MLKALDVETWVNQRRSNLDEAKRSASEIIDLVRTEGDAALLRMARKYEPEIDSIRVSREEIEAAYDEVDEQLVEAVVEAEARNHPVPRASEGARPLARGGRARPHPRRQDHAIDRAGLYVPGRRAAYPSTALMNAIPAKVAGVASLCAARPRPSCAHARGPRPRGRLGGLPDRRAQAIAAMALGTESIRPCGRSSGRGTRT